MQNKTILITGGAGFIGSNLAIYLKNKYPEFNILALDNFKRRGSELNIKRLQAKHISFIHGDIRCKEDLKCISNLDIIIECSAEPSVLAGVENNPEYVINTNLFGMVNCLELARINKANFIFLSTSRVYPYNNINYLKIKEEKTRFVWQNNQKHNGWSPEGINTNFNLNGPKTLYGATKLSCELLLIEYMQYYGIKGVINRCGVIAGPWQFGKIDQGVFSLWMKHHYFKKPLCYIGWGGKGKQVRDLLHVEDLCELIDLQINSLNNNYGKIYNIGGGRGVSLSLIETTILCQQITGNKIRIFSDSDNRPGDISLYITDNCEVMSDYGWSPRRKKEKILEDVYDWLKKNNQDWE